MAAFILPRVRMERKATLIIEEAQKGTKTDD